MTRPHVCVVGAGVGSLIALALGRRGFEVTLVDERPAILGGASDAQMARLHLGQHYSGDDRFGPDRLNTAQRCTLGALAWFRRYPEAVPAAGRWWQLITDDSMTAPDDYLAFCRRLATFHHELMLDDPRARELLGPTDAEHDGVHVLDPGVYAPHVAPDHVVLGVETRERVIDLVGLRRSIARDLTADAHVEVRLSTRVVRIDARPHGFVVHLGTGEQLGADAVVNCGWHDHRTEADPGRTVDPPAMSTRLRFVATAELPPSLRRAPSMFFHRGVLGNHTKLAPRTMRFVSEAVCNFRTIPGVGVPEPWRHLLVQPDDPAAWVDGVRAAVERPTDAADPPPGAWPLAALLDDLAPLLAPGPPAAGHLVHDRIATAIIEGYGRLVPAVRGCRRVRVTPTASVELGDTDIWRPDGTVHQRDWLTAVDEVGLVTVHPGKFTFGVLAAEEAVTRVLSVLGQDEPDREPAGHPAVEAASGA